MQIQVSTDHNMNGSENVNDHVRGVVEHAASHFSSHITRVEVHLADENGAKTGVDDKRCMMEARVENRRPIAVTHHAATTNEAISGCAAKLKRALSHEFERLREKH